MYESRYAIDEKGNALFFSDGVDVKGMDDYLRVEGINKFLVEESGLPGIAFGNLPTGHMRDA